MAKKKEQTGVQGTLVAALMTEQISLVLIHFTLRGVCLIIEMRLQLQGHGFSFNHAHRGRVFFKSTCAKSKNLYSYSRTCFQSKGPYVLLNPSQ